MAVSMAIAAGRDGSAQAPAQSPVFRTETEAVWVTATAMDREGRLVTDLRRDDFELLVDGVAQPINEFRSDHIPFALSIMFDLSGSLGESVGTMRRAMSALIDQFRPGDRANVGSFHTLPSVDARFSSNRETLIRSTAQLIGAVNMPCRGPWSADFWRHNNDGASGIWDAVACGIDTVAGDAETPRRVVLLITDGFDNVSITGQGEAQALADTYGVMVYVVAMVGSEGLNAAALRSLAAETGGGYFVLNQEQDMTATFARIADELRQQYVLGYSGPAGSAKKGKLEVRVKRPDVIARGRRASMTVLPVAATVTEAIEAGRNAPIAAVKMFAPPSAREGVFDRAARNALLPSDLPRLPLANLRTVALEMRKAGLEWIREGGAALEPLRRLQLATYVLDFLSVQDDFELWQNHDAPADLFEWASGLVRIGPPQPAERLWHLAGISLLQRLGAPWLLEIHLGYARSRFPNEPRFLLARAVAAEMRLWPQRRDETGMVIPEAVLVTILGRYAEAMSQPALRQEARLRLGYIELLRGRINESLALFDQAGTPDDPGLRYMLHLLRGKALTAAGRHDDAIAEFRLALNEVPYAQSATLALATALISRGRANEAAVLTSRMLSIPQPPLDPWIMHTFPEWRLWEPLMSQLRRLGLS